MSAAANAAGYLFRMGMIPKTDQVAMTEAQWLEVIRQSQSLAYQVGLAQGEIRGRLALVQELEADFGPGAEGLAIEDLPAIRARQTH